MHDQRHSLHAQARQFLGQRDSDPQGRRREQGEADGGHGPTSTEGTTRNYTRRTREIPGHLVSNNRPNIVAVSKSNLSRIPLDRGRELARRFHVDKLFAPLFDYMPKSNPFDDDVPEGPSSLTSGVSSLSITGSNNNMAAFISGLSDPSRVRGDALRMLNQARSEGLFSMMTSDYLLTQPTVPPPPPSPPPSLKRKRAEEKAKEIKPDRGKKKDITPAKRPKKKPPKLVSTEYIQYTPGVKKAGRHIKDAQPCAEFSDQSDDSLPCSTTRTLRSQRSRRKPLSRFPPPPGYEDVSVRPDHSTKHPSEGHLLRTRKELFCSGPPPSSEDDTADEQPISECSTPRPSTSEGGNEQDHDMKSEVSSRRYVCVLRSIIFRRILLE